MKESRYGVAAEMASRPFDPRLIALDSGSILLLFVSAAFQLAALVAQVFQAVLFGRIVAHVVLSHSGATYATRLLSELLIASFLVAALGYCQDRALVRIAGGMKIRLRARLLSAAGLRGQSEKSNESQTASLLVLTKGMNEIETYLVRFVPAAIYAVIAPITVIVYTSIENPLAGITELVTLSAIPPLMIIFGRTAGARSKEKWRALERLSSQFVESILAIPTLKGISALRRQEILIGDASRRLERDTMSTLYLAFLSTGVLEVVTSVAIALVAVGVGIRLADGSIAVAPSVTVLILAPVLYLSIRSASVQFHATVDASIAMDSIVMELGKPGRSLHRGTLSNASSRPGGCNGELAAEHLSIARGELRLVQDLQLELFPGDRLCVWGESGRGKTTVLRVLVGLERPIDGVVRYCGRDPGTLSESELSRWVSYLPQNPTFFEATLRDNILLGRQDPGNGRWGEVLEVTLLRDLVDKLPGGLEYRIPEISSSLSAGQRQRVALARAIILPRPLIVLDEPTSHLDEATEAMIWSNVTKYSAESLVVFATHRKPLRDTASALLDLTTERTRANLVGETSHG